MEVRLASAKISDAPHSKELLKRRKPKTTKAGREIATAARQILAHLSG
jgi:hypothetical protein